MDTAVRRTAVHLYSAAASHLNICSQRQLHCLCSQHKAVMHTSSQILEQYREHTHCLVLNMSTTLAYHCYQWTALHTMLTHRKLLCNMSMIGLPIIDLNCTYTGYSF
jgi:hypothetical protein